MAQIIMASVSCGGGSFGSPQAAFSFVVLHLFVRLHGK